MEERILRLNDVLKVTGIGRSSIYELQKQGLFPKSIQIANTCKVGWLNSEVQTWIQKQIAASRNAIAQNENAA